MRILALAAAASLAACAAIPDAVGPSRPAAVDNSARALAVVSLGERMYVDGPEVTPLTVLEDSRCPANVQCVWAGRFRVQVAVHLGAGDQLQELTLGEPMPVADGAIELVEVRPAPSTGTIALADYRFAFRFEGGL